MILEFSEPATRFNTAASDFGPMMKSAVVDFQTKQGLYPDGVVWKNRRAGLGID